MNSDPTFDRRRYLRVEANQIISICRLDDRDGLAHALDLSMGGVRFQSMGQEISVGEMLKVTLTLGQVTTSVVGQVRRVAALDEFTQEVGLCFLKMDDETRRFLQSSLPTPSEPGWSDDERRTYSRVLLESIVSVSRANMVDVAAQARDVSMGGVRFVVEDMELHLGDLVRMTVDIGGEPLRAVGQVVRSTDLEDFRQEIAVAFLDGDPAGMDQLRRRLEAAA